jgi:7-cyano-7-deazaguanine synthase in queuosine biosynthesis
MKKMVIGLSGGMDSTTLLGLYLEYNYEVHCVSFKYGSTHGIYEQAAANKIIKYYQEKNADRVIPYKIDIESVMQLFSSNLLQKCQK